MQLKKESHGLQIPLSDLQVNELITSSAVCAVRVVELEILWRVELKERTDVEGWGRGIDILFADFVCRPEPLLLKEFLLRSQISRETELQNWKEVLKRFSQRFLGSPSAC